MLNDVKTSLPERMEKTLEAFKVNLSKIRTGRAHTGLLDHVQVDYYDNMVPVSQVANITLIDGRTIGVMPWEKQMVAKIEKAIRDSDLGLNPATNGDLIRVPMPMLTEERRKDLIKVVRSEAEDTRVALRNIRRDANQTLKNLTKEKTISEDEEHRGQDEIQKITDKFIVEVDKILAQKETDLLAV